MTSEPIRPPMTLLVDLTFYSLNCWTATSDQLTGFLMFGDTIHAAQREVQEKLGVWLGDHVTLEFRNMSPDQAEL